jgi:hypothetical protein
MPHSVSAALATALLGLSGCHREAPSPSPAATTTPTVDAAPRAAPPVEAAQPAQQRMCEVEVSGKVKLPKEFAKAPAPLTFIAIGDCLAPSPRTVGFVGTTDGRFFLEVFVPWGADLTLCAASEPTDGAPSTLYGKAAIPMRADRVGEVQFTNLVVTLAPGPPKTFPHRTTPPASR